MSAAAVLLSILLFQAGVQAGDSLDTLLERLRTEDSPARRQAQLALLRGGAAIVPGLIRALESASPRTEEEIVRLVRRPPSPAWWGRAKGTEARAYQGQEAAAAPSAQP